MKKIIIALIAAGLGTTSLALAGSQWSTAVPSQVVVYQGCGANAGQAYGVVSLPGASDQYSFRVDIAGGSAILDVIRSSMTTGKAILLHLGEFNDPKVTFKMIRSYGCADSPGYLPLDAVAQNR